MAWENLNIIRILARNGAAINSEDDWGQTPLCLAAANNNLSAIEELHENGCDINYVMKSGKFEGGTVMHFAAATSSADTICLLLQLKGDTQHKDWRGRFPLHWSAREGHVDVMKRLLEHTAEGLFSVDNSGLTLLHLAASGGNSETAEWLLKHDFNTETKELTGWTPLHSAAEFGQHSMIDLLLDYNANINATNWTRSTPLHFAALRGQTKAVKTLLLRGADVNVKDHNTWTPLQLAVSGRHTDTVSLLLAAGGKLGGASCNQFVGCPLFF